ncbi:MAG: universal stress protein [Actinomycetota bacterium]|nr:universal stress protein [Actinomycetota bacterium]
MHEGHDHTIVVGFDGSEASVAALEWAAKEASLRKGRLCVVRAWLSAEFGTDDDLRAYTRTKVETEVQKVLGTASGVDWQAEALRGSPAKALIDHAADADLLVVGCRGHGGFAGLLLGSVSQQVAAHAVTPAVVIVHHH